MRVTRLPSVVIALFLTLASASSACAQLPQPPEVLPSDHVVTSVEKWDEVLGLLVQTVAGMRRMQAPPDSRGRTIDDDIDDFGISPDVYEHLQELREQARAQESDAKAVERIVAEAQPLLENELAKFAVIAKYWTTQEALAYHERLLESLLSSASDADRKPVRARIDETHQYLVTLLEEGLDETTIQARGETIARMTKAQFDTIGFYNERRVALAEQASRAGRVTLRSRNRHVPCPPPVSTTSDKPGPSLGPDNTSPESLYPMRAKRMGVEGPVVLRVRVSDAGCMESANVVDSAGDADLDEAALSWAENASYLPGVKDGKAAAGSFVFRVKFEIRD
jgi:TonB family protein